MNAERILRRHLTDLLTGENAHVNFDAATREIPFEQLGVRPAGLPSSIWQQVEHLRIAQWDIVRFSIDSQHVSPDFPDGYWPSAAGPPDETAWRHSRHAFLSDLQIMVDLVNDSSNDLYSPIPHGQGQTILREALLIADHNAYHLGQILTLRRLLGIW
ncbi:MAG: DinB family protein [Acidobacteriota bacterium]